MSENPTARFAPQLGPYELYENFQIEVSYLKKKFTDSGQLDESTKIGWTTKIELLSDIMENMFGKLTTYMNNSSKDKEIYNLKRDLEAREHEVQDLKDSMVQQQQYLAQKKASYKLKKATLNTQVESLRDEICALQSLLNQQKLEA